MKALKEKKIETPEVIAKKILTGLKEKADPQRARLSQRFFKEPIFSYGLTSKECRDMAREIYQMVKDDWDVKEAIKLCDILMPNHYLEPKGLAILILLNYKRDFPSRLFFKIKDWLSRNFCDNWATVDSLCPEAVGALLEKYPEFLEKVRGWAQSPNRWVKRAAAVSLIKLARRGKCLKTVYRISQMLFAVNDDLIEKANGWLLREAGKTDMARLEKFILGHGKQIPRTTIRYALERFDEGKRKKILFQTRK